MSHDIVQYHVWSLAPSVDIKIFRAERGLDTLASVDIKIFRAERGLDTLATCRCTVTRGVWIYLGFLHHDRRGINYISVFRTHMCTVVKLYTSCYKHQYYVDGE